MRKLIVSNTMSLDGFFAGPGGNPLVLNMDAAFDAYNLERMSTADTVLLGRSSFELFGSYWPMIANAPEDPSNPALSEDNREFSRRYDTVEKIVVSDSLEVATGHPWASTTVTVPRAEVSARVADEKARDGNDILIFASHILWNSLLNAGLVDEVHMLIGPAAIGEGVRAFSTPIRLDLLDVRTFPGSGNVLHRYVPAR